METVIYQAQLHGLLVEQVPEVRNELDALPGGVSIYGLLQQLYEVTSVAAHQHRFKVVKRCLVVAEDLMLHAEPKISNAVSTVYVYRLAMLLDERDVQADVIRYLLPHALRVEYRRQLSNCLP